MSLRKHVSLWVVFVVAVALSGCAAVFNNDKETVLVETDPPGAALSVNGQPFGKTPAKVVLAHDEAHVLLVELSGYQNASATVGTHIGVGWIILDILALPSILIPVIDAVGGYWYELDTNEVFFKLTPGGGGSGTTTPDKPKDTGRPVS